MRELGPAVWRLLSRRVSIDIEKAGSFQPDLDVLLDRGKMRAELEDAITWAFAAIDAVRDAAGPGGSGVNPYARASDEVIAREIMAQTEQVQDERQQRGSDTPEV